MEESDIRGSINKNGGPGPPFSSFCRFVCSGLFLSFHRSLPCRRFVTPRQNLASTARSDEKPKPKTVAVPDYRLPTAVVPETGNRQPETVASISQHFSI